MLRFVLLLLVLTNARWKPKVVRCDYLEANHLPSGSKQLIVWECRGPNPWPRDWTMNPCGTFDGKRWWDANGTIVEPYEAIETWTDHDPERRAYGWWMSQGSRETQTGVWHVQEAAIP